MGGLIDMSIKHAHQLKHLESRRDALVVEVENLLVQKQEAERNYTERKKKLSEINKQIKKLCTTSAEPIVTEHALLRYIERALGIDTEAIKTEILTEQIITTINKGGNCKISNGKGLKYIVKDRTIVSIIYEKES